jgi:hypothetical protein
VYVNDKLEQIGSQDDTDSFIVDGPYMSLMRFSDSDERETVLGPLFASAAKANVAVYGPEKFITAEAKQKILAEIKDAIHSKDDPVIELVATDQQVTSDTMPEEKRVKASAASMLKLDLDQPNAKAASNKVINDPKTADSTREINEMMRTSMTSVAPAVKAQAETRDNIMLRRAIDGYLFDCEKNLALLKNDESLQGAWQWIKSMYRDSKRFIWISCTDSFLVADSIAEDDGMVSSPLDLSYMGVYSIWMNRLGRTSISPDSVPRMLTESRSEVRIPFNR